MGELKKGNPAGKFFDKTPTKKTTTKKPTTKKTEPPKIEKPELDNEEDFLDTWKGFKIKENEKRTRRVQLVLTPSLYEWLKATADKDGSKVNDYIHRLLETLREEEARERQIRNAKRRAKK